MTDKSLAELINDLVGDDSQLGLSLLAAEAMKKYITSIVKARTFTITGDETHLSVQTILRQAENIDQPREYDFQSENVNEEDFLRYITMLLPSAWSMRCTPEDIMAAIEGTTSVTFNGSSEFRCYDCAKPLTLTVNGNNLHVGSESACEKNSEFYVDVDFPTGMVVFGDWPDRFSEIRDEGYLDECEGESINYLKGQRQRTEGFAKQGIFHLSVGNTSPRWYYNAATGEIQIGADGYDEESEEYVAPEGFESMGYFCTDLWWVTMLDKSRYDEMLSKLPGGRDKKYYTKDTEVATIKPGRYRFFSQGPDLDDDGYSRVYAKAQYLGPCGEIPKVRHVSEGKVALTPRQYAIANATRYPTLYNGQYEEIRFSVMDQLFNVLGNGVNSKGDFLLQISAPEGTEIPDELPPESAEKPAHMKDYVRAPYPNFEEKYSILWTIPLDVVPTDWLHEAVWFYDKCNEFFLSDMAGHYSGAYPPLRKDALKTVAEQEKQFEKYRKEGQSEEEFNAIISKNWECEYTGDTEDFLKRRWEQRLNAALKFIDKTQKRIHAELTSRQAS